MRKLLRHLVSLVKGRKPRKPRPAPIPEPHPIPVPEPTPIPEPIPHPEPIPEPVPEPAPIPEPTPEPVPEPPPAPEPIPEPPPVVQAGWSASRYLTDSGGWYNAISGSGPNLHIARGDGALYTSASTDEGNVFSPFAPRGSGKLYLESPVASDRKAVAIVTVTANKVISDFWGRREVGDLLLVTSRDGVNYSAQKQITSGRNFLRIATTLVGEEITVVGMDWDGQTWNIREVYSADFGTSWTDKIIVAGTNIFGAGRPVLCNDGADQFMAWMDARDNKPATTIEGGAPIPFSTEVYGKRKVNGQWQADYRVTNGVEYAGRPAVHQSGQNVLLVYDFGSPNVIMGKSSTNGGATFSPRFQISDSPRFQTHAVVSGVGNEFTVAWSDAFIDNYARTVTLPSNVLGPIEKVSSGGIPMLADTTGFTHLISAEGGAGRLQYRRKARGL